MQNNCNLSHTSIRDILNSNIFTLNLKFWQFITHCKGGPTSEKKLNHHDFIIIHAHKISLVRQLRKLWQFSTRRHSDENLFSFRDERTYKFAYLCLTSWESSNALWIMAILILSVIKIPCKQLYYFDSFDNEKILFQFFLNQQNSCFVQKQKKINWMCICDIKLKSFLLMFKVISQSFIEKITK